MDTGDSPRLHEDVHALAQLAGSPALQNNDPTVEQFTHAVNWFRAAT